MERLTTGMQHRPCYVNIYHICQTTDCYSLYLMIFTIIRSIALSAACVHSNYHTPNKEIVIGRCGIRECMHSKMLHLLMCS